LLLPQRLYLQWLVIDRRAPRFIAPALKTLATLALAIRHATGLGSTRRSAQWKQRRRKQNNDKITCMPVLWF
jgi:hypothetical protein